MRAHVLLVTRTAVKADDALTPQQSKTNKGAWKLPPTARVTLGADPSC